MSYTTFSEVEGDFKDTEFTATSNVLDSDATQFIVEADALINAYVGTVYVAPVVTPGEGLNLLKLLSRSLVVNRIKRVLEVKQIKSEDANQNIVSVLLSVAQVMKILTDIQNKDLFLSGAVALIAGAGFYNNNVANSIEPVIKKDERQW